MLHKSIIRSLRWEYAEYSQSVERAKKELAKLIEQGPPKGIKPKYWEEAITDCECEIENNTRYMKQCEDLAAKRGFQL